MKQNQWTSDLMQSGRVDEWVPPEGKLAGVEHYFATAASIVEPALPHHGFHFHFTANTNSVPVTGPKSIVFVMSEENAAATLYWIGKHRFQMLWGETGLDGGMVLESSLTCCVFVGKRRNRMETCVDEPVSLAD